jgi:hypothetical protein
MDTPILNRLIEELKVMPEDLQYRWSLPEL